MLLLSKLKIVAGGVLALFLILVALVGSAASLTMHTPLVPQVTAMVSESRDLSLSEAVRRCLEHGGFRVHGAGAGLRISLPGVDLLTAERNAAQRVLNAEVAYWNLYTARQELSVKNDAVALARETLDMCKLRQKAGRCSDKDVHLAEKQYSFATKEAKEATDRADDSERQLASLIGLTHKPGHLVSGDAPKLAIVRPDWAASLKETLDNRAELRQARTEVWIDEKLLATEKFARALLGVPLEEVRSIGNNWHGLPRYSFPRSDPRLRLERAMETVKQMEIKAQSFLAKAYGRISDTYEQIRANRAQREAFSEQVQVRNKEYKAGRGTLDVLLEAQRFSTDALSSEYAAIASYNNALASFDYARGAVLKRHKISMEEVGSE